MSEFAISISGLTKSFRRFDSPGWRALDALGLPVSAKHYDTFVALRDINLNISCGEKVALIGRNGAGKSTLLRIISGQMNADRGEVTVNGHIQALMTLGTGFHPEFTGMENIRSALAYQGLRGLEIEEHINDIAEFSELENFLNRPVKEYSAGMYARLAFAAATTVKPEILIIDEILGAGDAYFLGKCIQRMKSLTNDGTTVLYVSHDISSVQLLCDRGIWLEKGKVNQDGKLLSVSKAYLASVRSDEEQRMKAKSMSLTRGDVQAIIDSSSESVLLRFIGSNNIPPKTPLQIRSIRYGENDSTSKEVCLDAEQSGDTRLIVHSGYMNWKWSDAQEVWCYGDYGGRYIHAPIQISMSPSINSSPWIEFELRPSKTCDVALEQYDAEDNSYKRIVEIPCTQGEEFTKIKTRLGSKTNIQKSEVKFDASLVQLQNDDRYGSNEIQITAFGFFDSEGVNRHTLLSGEDAYAIIRYVSDTPVDSPVPVIAIYRPDGSCAMQVISSLSGVNIARLEGSGSIKVEFSPLYLGPGDYLVSVALFKDINLASSIEPNAYDLHDRCYALKMLPPPGINIQIGVVNQPASWVVIHDAR